MSEVDAMLPASTAAVGEQQPLLALVSRRKCGTKDKLVIRDSQGVSQETEKHRKRNTKREKPYRHGRAEKKTSESEARTKNENFFFFLQKRLREETTSPPL